MSQIWQKHGFIYVVATTLTHNLVTRANVLISRVNESGNENKITIGND